MATISENLQTIKDSINAIKQAIIDKGGTIEGDITTWADAINNIDSGGNLEPSLQQIKCFSIITYGKFPYETGMTWTDYLNNEYGKMKYYIGGVDMQIYEDGGYVSCLNPAGFPGYLRVSGSTTNILVTDTIDINITNYELYREVPKCCFIANTLILMGNNTYKNIQEIQEGDEVLSYDIDNNYFYSTTVKKLIIKEDIHTIATIKFENGVELIMNEYHPILTDRGWHSLTHYNNYDELIIGDNCKTSSGWSKIISIDRYISEEGVKMYNLDVIDKDENNDIELNDNFIANNIVVHNGYC